MFMKHDDKWQMNDLVGCQLKIALSWGGKEVFDSLGFFLNQIILWTSLLELKVRRKESIIFAQFFTQHALMVEGTI